MAEARQEGDSLLPASSSNFAPKMSGFGASEDTGDIDVEGMDTLMEDLRTSPQHSSDDSLGSDSDDEMSAIGTPLSLPADPSSQMSNTSMQASQNSASSSSSSSSSSSEEESELEDD